MIEALQKITKLKFTKMSFVSFSVVSVIQFWILVAVFKDHPAYESGQLADNTNIVLIIKLLLTEKYY